MENNYGRFLESYINSLDKNKSSHIKEADYDFDDDRKCYIAETLLSKTILKIAKLYNCAYLDEDKADDLAEQFLDNIMDAELSASLKA